MATTALYRNRNELFQSLLKGSKLLADNVGSTLGPKGHTVLIGEDGHKPVITKDGVTVAQFVHSDDPFEQLAIDVIKQASDQTNVDASDGTTSTTLIANAILRESHKFLLSDVHPFDLKRDLEEVLKVVEAKIEEIASQVDSPKVLEDVANIASNGDRIIATIVRKAVEAVGQDGSITIEQQPSRTTTLEIVEGFTFDSGLFNPVFVTDEKKGVAKYNDPYLLITDQKISDIDDILPILELVARDSKPLIIVAEDFEGDALGTCAYNVAEHGLKLAFIKAPRYGEERRNILEDLAISSGAKFFQRSRGDSLKTADLPSLGRARSIESNKFATIIVDAKGDTEKINQRIEQLREEILHSSDHSTAKTLQERMARLAATIAIIKIGGDTEIERTEKHHRMEDALGAVVAAQEKGCVPGGGVTLLRIAQQIETDSQNVAQKVFKTALEEPFRVLATNSGRNFETLKEKVLQNENLHWGFDFQKQEMVDLVESGIIDPAKVSLKSIRNATSAASTLLTTSHSIVIERRN